MWLPLHPRGTNDQRKDTNHVLGIVVDIAVDRVEVLPALHAWWMNVADVGRGDFENARCGFEARCA